uniref:Beta-defensin n=1 Tax=Equus caballus TaxID=9796 RepID=A0A3Q2GYV2_HORSE
MDISLCFSFSSFRSQLKCCILRKSFLSILSIPSSRLYLVYHHITFSKQLPLSQIILSIYFCGLASSENHCLNVSGICRRDICKRMEDLLGNCRRRWKCCRPWWILMPVPTPIIYSDYQPPFKPKLK